MDFLTCEACGKQFNLYDEGEMYSVRDNGGNVIEWLAYCEEDMT